MVGSNIFSNSEANMKLWVCRKCGHEVHAKDRPPPITWHDQHVCYFYSVMENMIEKEVEENA